MSRKILLLVLVGVARADYLSDLQAPAEHQLALVADFNGGGRRTHLANGAYNGNDIATGGFPGISATRGAFGANTAEIGVLKTSGTTIGGSVLPRGIGAGEVGSGAELQTLGLGGSDPVAELEEAIGGGGVPEEDHPILSTVPSTEFSCDGQLPGYYADTSEQARCQVFHICQDSGRIRSFLCPNGTVFNQQYFVCDWWYNFDCSTAHQFYGLNAQIGQDAANFSVFGSASSSQGSFSFFGNGNVNSLTPSTSYHVPVGSASNQQGSTSYHVPAGSASNQQGSTSYHVPAGSASNQQGSTSYQVPAGSASNQQGSTRYHVPAGSASNQQGSTSYHVPAGSASNQQGSTSYHVPTGSASNQQGSTSYQVPAGSASNQQGSFSDLSVGAGNRDAPSSYFGTPSSINDNSGTSANQKGLLRKADTRVTNGVTAGGFTVSTPLDPAENFGSATDQRPSSFFVLTVGAANKDAPSAYYATPSSIRGDSDTSTNQKPLLNIGNTRTANGGTSIGFTGSNVQAPSDTFSSATNQQGSFSALTVGAGNIDAPSTYYGVPSSNEGNSGTSSNQKPVLRRINTRIADGSTTSGLYESNAQASSDRFGSATDQRSSFSALTVGVSNEDTSFPYYGSTSTANGNFGASTIQNVALRKDHTKTANRSRNSGLSRLDIQPPSGLYQIPGK